MNISDKNNRMFGIDRSSSILNNFINTIKTNLMMIEDTEDGKLIDAGHTYLGQMIAHDIVPSTTNHPNRKKISPYLSLNSLYGDNNDHAYFDREGKFILGSSKNEDGDFEYGNDIFRDSSGIPLIGDVRNDENKIISQLHLFWQKLHNKIIDYLKSKNNNLENINYFEKARKYLIYIFHKVIKEDYLEQVLHEEVYSLYFSENNIFIFKELTFDSIPLEFSRAAFRFGHSMIRNSYILKFEASEAVELSLVELLNKEKSHLKSNLVIDWELFFETKDFNKVRYVDEIGQVKGNTRSYQGNGATHSVQLANQIDTKLVTGMDNLRVGRKEQHIVDINIKSNSDANINNFGSILNKIVSFSELETIFTNEQAAYVDVINKLNPSSETKFSLSNDFSDLTDKLNGIPLWLFVLLEAECSRNLAKQKTIGLGIVGSIIISEVLSMSLKGAHEKLGLNPNDILEIDNYIDKEIGSKLYEPLKIGKCINYLNRG